MGEMSEWISINDQPPEKEFHFCTSVSNEGSFHCYQDPTYNLLYLNHGTALITVQACPFCGWKLEDK